MQRILIIAVFLASLAFSSCGVMPYSMYGNLGYIAGQQIGNAIALDQKYGRKNLRTTINNWGECRNGSLSIEHGAVAIYGTNGYYCSHTVDSRISAKLKAINNDRGNVTDLNILENGQFIIIYNNGKDWYGVIPSTLSSALREYAYGTQFKSISFNESGIYAITTSDEFKSNNATYQAFHDDNIKEFGELLSVNICENGAAFCYSSGTRFCGRIPKTVESAVRLFSSIPKFVKFNKHADYLICTANGSYSYHISNANESYDAPTVAHDYVKKETNTNKTNNSNSNNNSGNTFYTPSPVPSQPSPYGNVATHFPEMDWKAFFNNYTPSPPPLTTTPSGNVSAPAPSPNDNSNWETYYRNTYARQEQFVQQEFNSIINYKKSNSSNSGATSHDKYGSFTASIVAKFHQLQQELQNIRREAASKGVKITASQWETATISFY